MLERLGISVEFSHHEVAPGQQEIDLRYADALSTADNILTTRHVIKEVALTPGRLRDLHAQAVQRPAGQRRCTPTCRCSRATRTPSTTATTRCTCRRSPSTSSPVCCGTPPEITAVTNQWVNSYKRLTWGGEAPHVRLLGPQQPLSAMVRVPMYKPTKGNSTRIEVRSPDSATNPYLCFALLLAAGLKGVEEGYELPPGAEDDVWALSDAERRAMGITPAAGLARRGDRGHGAQRAGRRDPRRARLRLLPPQQARGVGGVPPARSRRSSSTATCRSCRWAPLSSSRTPSPRTRGTWRAGSPEEGLELQVVEPWRGDALPTSLDGYDALVVMGGPQQAYDDGSAPVAAPDQGPAARRRSGRRCRPSASASARQLLAEATGGAGRAGRRTGPELGAELVGKRDLAGDDPLFWDLPLSPVVVQWHWDVVVDLPPARRC